MKTSTFSRRLVCRLFLFLLIGALGLVSAPAQADPVVPGRSAVRVRLGQSRADVLKTLGKPSKSTRWRTGETQDA